MNSAALAQDSSQMSVHIYHSPRGISWKSPQSLARSVVRNTLTFEPHSIGHVSIKLECGTWTNRPAQTRFTGMTQGKGGRSEVQLLLKDKIGLGILFHTFRGRMDRAQDLKNELPWYHKNGGLAIHVAKIKDESCHRMADYIQAFDTANYDQFYGLHLRPRHREGAGCSAFIASVLEVGGLLSPETDLAWKQTVNVPWRWMGSPSRNVWLTSLLKSPRARSWANETEPHKKITFYDPDQMYRWAKKEWSKRRPHEKQKIGKTYVFFSDLRANPVPHDPFFF